MIVDAFLAKKIEAICQQIRPVLICVCGAADLGKSHLSQKIVDRLTNKGIPSGHLTLDSFLIERSERIKKGISGYQIESYDLPSIRNALFQFKQEQQIVYTPYNHSEGRTSNSFMVIEPCSVLILDGVHSMHESISAFNNFNNFSIFLFTNDETLKKLRFEADLQKRKLTTELANRNSESEFIQYKMHVEPYKTMADLRLYLENKWKYIIQE